MGMDVVTAADRQRTTTAEPVAGTRRCNLSQIVAAGAGPSRTVPMIRPRPRGEGEIPDHGQPRAHRRPVASAGRQPRSSTGSAARHRPNRMSSMHVADHDALCVRTPDEPRGRSAAPFVVPTPRPAPAEKRTPATGDRAAAVAHSAPRCPGRHGRRRGGPGTLGSATPRGEGAVGGDRGRAGRCRPRATSRNGQVVEGVVRYRGASQRPRGRAGSAGSSSSRRAGPRAARRSPRP